MKLIKIWMLSMSIVLLAACDAGFDEINTSKTGILSINPVYVLNNSMIRSSFTTSTLIYEEAIVQQVVTPNSGVVSGGNYNIDNRGVTPGLWVRYYREVLKGVVDVINYTKDDPTRSNLYNMALIWRAFAIMTLTDTYGDVPFEQAGLGYLTANVYPAYDSQEAIYEVILNDLAAASAALDAAKTIETSDILYAGNVSQWKRFGYSLLFRAAMRIADVNETKAKGFINTAVAGGLMTANTDNAVIRHTANYTNEIGNALTSTEAANFYLAKPFVDFLKDNNDPRLTSIAVRYVGAQNGSQQTAGTANRTAGVQIGMPLGYNNTSIGPIVTSDGLASFYDYSQVDRTRITKNTFPMFFVTNAQTKLLLAEAVVRNYTTGDAAALYSEGIKAHMQQMSSYDANSTIADADIITYVDNHPLGAGTEIEDINTQYWVASFLNGPEVFANFRRTGFPTLTPNPYPDKTITGDFISRITYPDTEFSVNTANVQQALERQGPDNLDVHVWWDVD